jgi:mycobactin lysine-N-oxygenase
VVNGIDDALYENWVAHGRRPPAHRDFASYIVRAIANSQAIVRPSRITSLDYDNQAAQWLVTSSDAQNVTSTERLDGVVVTGSGAPLPRLPNSNARVFDGHSFWRNLPQILHLLQSDPTPAVGIIGAGGTAAAIAHWFVREGITEIPITVIGREATLFIRTSTPFEDRLFTDETAWSALAPHIRETFIARLTRGVVWDYVLHRLGDARNIGYLSAEVRGFSASPALTPLGSPPLLMAALDDPPDPRNPGPVAPPPAPKGFLDATVFVDARGFDPWHFANLLPVQLRGHFANRASVVADVDYSLCVGPPFPSGFHVPMLASVQGPAAPNLMALGWMSDRILGRYIQPGPIVAHWRAAGL